MRPRCRPPPDGRLAFGRTAHRSVRQERRALASAARRPKPTADQEDSRLRPSLVPTNFHLWRPMISKPAAHSRMDYGFDGSRPQRGWRAAIHALDGTGVTFAAAVSDPSLPSRLPTASMLRKDDLRRSGSGKPLDEIAAELWQGPRGAFANQTVPLSLPQTTSTSSLGSASPPARR